jgi:hypothetical protein
LGKSTAPPSLRLAPDVPDLAALGAQALEDFLAEPPRVVTAARVRRAGAWWSVPLPGTPDEHGIQHEKPRGAGTGRVLVRAWNGGGLDRWRMRVTHPRSTSAAARHWNLTCHLQAHGVGAPRLVALGERGGESFVIVRALDDFTPPSKWLTSEREVRARRCGLRSLVLALDALLRSGAWLPGRSLDNVMIQTGADDCVAVQLVNLRGETELLRERGLVRVRLPVIAFTNFDGGRIYPKLSRDKRIEFLRASGGVVAANLSDRERMRVVRAALGELTHPNIDACR